jgi:hypoxanthine phosphoribosyltransferase
MKTSGKYETPTWNQVHTMLVDQSEKILGSDFKPDVIIGVARGGVIPARILSDLLENSNFTVIRVKSRHGNPDDRREPVLIQPLIFPVEEKKVLVVDDVADTGRSLDMVKEHVQQQEAAETRIATLYYKPWSSVKPDYYEKETEKWIVFPWDVTEHLRRAAVKQGGTLSVREISGLPEKLTNRVLKQMREKMQCKKL